MNQNLVRLQEEFLAKNPGLYKKSKRYSRTSNLGGFTIVISAFTHMANFWFFESLVLFFIMIIIPLIILIVLYLNGPRHYLSQFDSAMQDYIPNLLDSIEGASLEYKAYGVEMTNAEIKELGFLHENIHSSFKPIRKHSIKGTYKNIDIEICELDYKHLKSKSRGLNLGWKPSTVISFNYPKGFNDILKFYKVKSENYYYVGQAGNGFPTVNNLHKMVKLKEEKIKTNIKYLDYNYLTLTSNKEATKELFTDKFLDRLLAFHKHNYRIKEDSRIYDAKLLTLYKDKLSIVIFNRKLLYPRVSKIFEAYFEELNSILHFVDIFSNPSVNKEERM